MNEVFWRADAVGLMHVSNAAFTSSRPTGLVTIKCAMPHGLDSVGAVSERRQDHHRDFPVFRIFLESPKNLFRGRPCRASSNREK